ncbi:hypothetical protein BU25DRAFT_231119 [Macroventuria anomochaeta]|uniref:Uncharacterized protein n=1 Tax=Macroventuria anomochaeta TaxID=301207 RepID=A0ACB6RIS4_9PLEO|nr:uncharacterized protein BU25DRAFT_231119 [Macroventuria anomochaeta]KAF2621810.1 hypothetical protein BU25DRAFT_231119 [Macroventuria anomochaeta]
MLGRLGIINAWLESRLVLNSGGLCSSPSHALGSECKMQMETYRDALLPCVTRKGRGPRVAAERHCQGHACSHATASSIVGPEHCTPKDLVDLQNEQRAGTSES